MKKLSFLLACMLLLPLGACGGAGNPEKPTTPAPDTTSEVKPDQPIDTFATLKPKPTTQPLPNEQVGNNLEIKKMDYTVAGTNTARGADQLIVYTTQRGESTGTNLYGLEAVVVDNRILRVGGNNNEIPQDGYVLSGHGAAFTWLSENAYTGALVEWDADNGSVTIISDKQAYVSNAVMLYNHLEATLTEYRAENSAAEAADAMLVELAGNIDTLRAAASVEDITIAYRAINGSRTEYARMVVPSTAAEIRGVWHIVEDKTKEDVRKSLQKIADAGFNTVMLEVFAHGYVIYPNSAYCKQLPDTKLDFDVLEEYVKVGKELGIGIHAWATNYFVGEPSYHYDDNTSGSPIIDEHPNWVGMTKNGSQSSLTETGFIYINQTDPEVSAFLLGMYTEIMERYEVAGINIDYIRYTAGSHDPNRSMGFEPSTIAKYKAETGVDITTITNGSSAEWQAFTQWRADHITAFVQSLQQLIDQKEVELNRMILLSAATAAEEDYAMNEKCQDWSRWLKEGYLDFLTPMIYYENDNDTYAVARYILESYPGTPIIAGLPLYTTGDYFLDQLTQQVTAAREAGCQGVCFFSSYGLKRKTITVFTEGVFRDKADWNLFE